MWKLSAHDISSYVLVRFNRRAARQEVIKSCTTLLSTSHVVDLKGEPTAHYPAISCQASLFVTCFGIYANEEDSQIAQPWTVATANDLCDLKFVDLVGRSRTPINKIQLEKYRFSLFCSFDVHGELRPPAPIPTLSVRAPSHVVDYVLSGEVVQTTKLWSLARSVYLYSFKFDGPLSCTNHSDLQL